jgi:hypothetical protein
VRQAPQWRPNLIPAAKNGHDKSLHRRQQNQAVFEKLVERFTVPGDVVWSSRLLDPAAVMLLPAVSSVVAIAAPRYILPSDALPKGAVFHCTLAILTTRFSLAWAYPGLFQAAIFVDAGGHP